MICYITLTIEKKSYKLNNDDVINLQTLLKMHIFLSILQLQWPVSPKHGTLESLVLMMTNNCVFGAYSENDIINGVIIFSI